ncbi:MAG: hypothetical protein R3A44_25780 [Caldilineaceae bacterium]
MDVGSGVGARGFMNGSSQLAHQFDDRQTGFFSAGLQQGKVNFERSGGGCNWGRGISRDHAQAALGLRQRGFHVEYETDELRIGEDSGQFGIAKKWRKKSGICG